MGVIKDNAIISATPASDHSSREGYFVENSAGSVEVVNAATDEPLGVLVDGETTAGQDSVALMNYKGTVHVKLSGTVVKYDRLELAAGGTVITEIASGARVIVGQALEAGVSGDLIEVALQTPITKS